MVVPNQPEFETFASHTLTIRTLGGTAIVLRLAPSVDTSLATPEDRLIKVETHTIEALLIYLACQGRPVSRDLLAELLWPERSQQQASANLRLALHRLRRQLDPFLLVTRRNIGLNPGAAIEVDALRFEACLADGRLAQATDLYQGDFLDGFYLDDSPAFEQWALLERERLRTLALAAWQQQIEQLTTAGHVQRTVDAAQRLLQLDPLHEPTHRQLMRLLAQTGQRSAALAQYETCRHLLKVELDVPPDETTTALAEQIRAGELDRETRRQGDKETGRQGATSHAVDLLFSPSSLLLVFSAAPIHPLNRSGSRAGPGCAVISQPRLSALDAVRVGWDWQDTPGSGTCHPFGRQVQ